MLLEFNLREDIQKYFPRFEYFNCTESARINFFRADNLVGMQQEAFLSYFIIKHVTETFNQGATNIVGLDIGCGQNIHPFCIGISNYYGIHPTMGGEHICHFTCLAEKVDAIFNPGSFNFIVVSHILEHLEDPATAFRKWLNLLRRDGRIFLISPDARFEDKSHPWDPDHKVFFTPDDFEKQIIIPNKDILRTEVFNDMNNSFSFNFVGRRI